MFKLNDSLINKINEVFKIDLPDWHDYLPETVGEFFDEQNN